MKTSHQARLLCPLVVLACSAWARGCRALRAGLVALLATTAFVVAVGGDFMPLARFLIPSLPLALLLTAVGLHRLLPGRRSDRRPLFDLSLPGLLQNPEPVPVGDLLQGGSRDPLLLQRFHQER